MNELTLREFTVTSDPKVWLSTQKEAEEYFFYQNIVGRVELCRVACKDGIARVLWLCFGKKNKIKGLLPAFHDDMFLVTKDMNPKKIISGVPETVKKYDMIYDEGCLYLFEKYGDNFTNIRRVVLFAYQGLVEIFFRLRGIEPLDVSLALVTEVQTNRTLLVCWRIYFYDESSDEEIAYLFPVDIRDDKILKENDVNCLNHILLEESKGFTVQGVRYRSKRDERGQVYLIKDPMQLVVKNEDVLQKKQGRSSVRPLMKCSFATKKGKV